MTPWHLTISVYPRALFLDQHERCCGHAFIKVYFRVICLEWCETEVGRGREWPFRSFHNFNANTIVGFGGDVWRRQLSSIELQSNHASSVLCNGFMIATAVSHLRLSNVMVWIWSSQSQPRHRLTRGVDAPLKRPSNEFMTGRVKTKTFAYYIYFASRLYCGITEFSITRWLSLKTPLVRYEYRC